MRDKPAHILLVEDEPAHAELVQRAFEANGESLHLSVVGTLSEARACLAGSSGYPDLVIADWRLPDGEGLDLLSGQPDWMGTPVIIMTSYGNERIAVEAMKRGALDYVVKSEVTLADMAHIAQRAIRESAMRAERARMETALRGSEQRFREAFDNAPIGMAIVGLDDRILQVNQALSDILGYSRNELLSKTVAAITHPDDRQSEAEQKAQTRAGRSRSFQMETRYMHADGHIVWGQLSVSLATDEAGQPLYYLGQLEDITKRKRAEQALEQYARRLEILREIDQAILAAQSVEAIAQAALTRIQRMVPCWRARVFLLDFEAGEAREAAVCVEGEARPASMRLSLRDFGVGDDPYTGRVRVVDRLNRAAAEFVTDRILIEEGAQAHVEAPLQTQSQIIGTLALDAKVPNAFQAEHVEIVREVADQLAVAIQNAILLDQTQRHADELERRVAERTRELAEANERLQELDLLKTKFVSDVSHELRTPAANLKLYLQLLKRGKPEKRDHYQLILEQQADRLAQLIEGILNLSRLELGRGRVAFAPVDVNHVVGHVVEAHRSVAEVVGLTLSFDAAPNLPRLMGEPNQLAQVVTNLVANAIRYTSNGEVSIRTRLDATRGQVLLQVTDSGMGIDPADLPHIFERFYRGSRASQSDIPGTGLGLAIVKEIVDLHGGTIDLESFVGKGSTFRVWLPLLMPDHQHGATDSPLVR